MNRLQAWNNTAQYRDELETLFRLVNPEPGQRVLDYGCGTGFAVQIFQKKVQNVFDHSGYAQIYGWDVSNYVPDELRNSPEFEGKFLKDISGMEHVFHAVYLQHVFAHIMNPDIALRHIRQMLVTGGKVVIMTPNLSYLELLKADNVPHQLDQTCYHHYTPESLRAILRRNYFDVLQIGQTGVERKGVKDVAFAVAMK